MRLPPCGSEQASHFPLAECSHVSFYDSSAVKLPLLFLFSARLGRTPILPGRSRSVPPAFFPAAPPAPKAGAVRRGKMRHRARVASTLLLRGDSRLVAPRDWRLRCARGRNTRPRQPSIRVRPAGPKHRQLLAPAGAPSKPGPERPFGHAAPTRSNPELLRSSGPVCHATYPSSHHDPGPWGCQSRRAVNPMSVSRATGRRCRRRFDAYLGLPRT